MKYYFVIGIILGLILIINSIKRILKLKSMIKMKGIFVGCHRIMGRNNEYVSWIQLNINGKEIEKDLNYYSVFLRKGKKITIFYNLNNNTIDCSYGYIFTLVLGTIFLLGSLYCIFTL